MSHVCHLDLIVIFELFKCQIKVISLLIVANPDVICSFIMISRGEAKGYFPLSTLVN